MEKFSRFNDQFTSVNPFTLPPYSPSVVTVLAAVAASAVKAPILAVISMVYFGTSFLTSLLPFGSSRNIHRATVERVCARMVLFVLGIWSLPEVTVSKQAVRTRPSKSSPPHAVSGGDVLLCNRCSWVDVLVLAALYAPAFTVTAKEGGLRQVSLWQALQAAVRGSPDSLGAGSNPAVSVDAVISAAQRDWVRRPVVVFPEGAPTNNKAVLSFTPAAEQAGECIVAIARATGGDRGALRVPTTHVLALKYSWPAGSLPPVYTAGSVGAHVWYALAAGGGWCVSVMRLPEGHDPQPGDFYASSALTPAAVSLPAAGGPVTGGGGGGSEGALPSTWPGAVRDGMVQLLRGVRPVSLDAARYDEYVAFHAEWRHGLAAQGRGKKRE